MIDYSKYTKTNKTVKFTNGKSFEVYAKETKKGIRYFYSSFLDNRMLPVSKKDIK